MKTRFVLFASAVAALSLVPLARAEQIAYFSDSITSADASELGRASRSGTQQTWTNAETYTGQLNATTQYFYKTYDFAASSFAGAPYVEISIDDNLNTADFFVSAFAGSYDPSQRGNNWLGDEGGSGEYTFYEGVPGDARYFDVTLPIGQDLVLLVNSTAGGTVGLNQPFDIDVAAYADTLYDDPLPVAATPEPGTLLMTFTGLLGTVGMARRRLFARA